VICSDVEEHRRRIETRRNDIAGLKVVTWQEVVERSYEPWDRSHMVLDTAHRSFDDAVQELSQWIPKAR